MCDDPLYVLHILSDSARDPPISDMNLCCAGGFLIAETNTRTCLKNGEWELKTSQMTCEGGLHKMNINIYYTSVHVKLLVAFLCSKL